jgi:mannose-1-phosphate guanylyltransferase
MKVLHDEDEQGNIIVGDGMAIDTTNTVINSTGRLVAVVGVDNLVVVETDDAVMVCDKSKAQDVKKIVDSLTEKERTELL